MGGFFSSISKGFKSIGKALGGSSGVLGSLTGGLGSLLGSDNPGDSIADTLDPGNIFHESAADRAARRQWELEYALSKQNYLSQEKWNDLNYQQSVEAFNYQKELNATQMEREDTAVQRRVADLKAAGLSPTLAAGSPASSTPVHAGTAPQGQAPQQLPPSDIKAQRAMFKEQMMKDYMALAMTLQSNMADISRTKAETELIKAKYGEQDIVNRYKEQMLQNNQRNIELKNLGLEIANNFNRLASSGRLSMMSAEYAKLRKELKVMDVDLQIRENEALRQVYYTARAELENQLIRSNIDLNELRKENLDLDSISKAYAVKYALDNNVPLSGQLSQYGALFNIFHGILRHFGIEIGE